MHFFKKKVVVSESIEIPGWEQTPYHIVAKKWSQSAGLGEAWDKCLQNAEPVDVMACLQKVTVEKGKESVAVGRRGWILLSAYRKQREERLRMVTKVLELECQINALNEKIEKFKVSDKNATAMHVSNQEIVAKNKNLKMENKKLKMENEQLENLSKACEYLMMEYEQLEKLSKVSDKKVSALNVVNKQIVAENENLKMENEKLKMENEHLSDRLKAAESSGELTASKSEMCMEGDIQYASDTGMCDGTASECSMRVGKVSCSYEAAEPSIKRRPVTCFSCGRQGHIAKYCRFSGSETQKRVAKVKCFACGRLGHIARSCPAQKERPVRKCYMCGKPGHISVNCLAAKSKASSVKDNEKHVPKIGEKEKEVYSSMWEFRHWQSGHRRHSPRGPCQGVKPQSDKNDSVKEESPHVNLG